jgi:hypothetical protein
MSKQPQPETTITAPYADSAAGYCPRHLDVQLAGDQPRRCRRLLDGLIAAGACLANGRPVKSPADAVRWLVDQLPAA